MANASDQKVSINVKPDVMLDETLDISVTGLVVGSKITLRLYLKQAKAEFDAHGQYIADCNGRIRLNEDISLGGTYCGKCVFADIVNQKSEPLIEMIIPFIHLFPSNHYKNNKITKYTHKINWQMKCMKDEAWRRVAPPEKET